MPLKLLLQLSIRNIMRHKRRNGLLLAAIVVAVAAVMVSNSLIRGMQYDKSSQSLGGGISVPVENHGKVALFEEAEHRGTSDSTGSTRYNGHFFLHSLVLCKQAFASSYGQLLAISFQRSALGGCYVLTKCSCLFVPIRSG